LLHLDPSFGTSSRCGSLGHLVVEIQVEDMPDFVHNACRIFQSAVVS